MRSFAVVGVGLAVTIAIASCREPTQITVALTTDVGCTTVTKVKTELSVGSRASVDTTDAQTFQSTQCAEAAGRANLGDVALVPSERGDEVAIRVMLSTDPAKPSTGCATDPKNCIVARRIVRYVEHTSLRLPIELASSCKGVVCGTDQTCVGGACTSAVVDVTQCPGQTCGTESLPPLDGGADVGPDVATDAGCPTCGGSGCANLATDAKNCGACGFVCGTGTCIEGGCRLLLSTTVPVPDPTEDGAVAVLASSTADQVFFTRTKKAPLGVYRTDGDGTIAASSIYPTVGLGLGAAAGTVALTSSFGATRCPPSLAGCGGHALAPGVGPYAAVEPTTTDAVAVLGGVLVSSSATHDVTASPTFAGAFGASVGQVLLQSPFSGQFALRLYIFPSGQPANSAWTIVEPQAFDAVLGDPESPRFFYTRGKTIVRIDTVTPTAPTITAIYTNLPAIPRAFALEPGKNGRLYWLDTEGTTDVIHVGSTDGSSPIGTAHLGSKAGAIKSIAVGNLGLYWYENGVPMKGHK